MPNMDIPYTLEQQILLMKNYVVFKRKDKIKKLLDYSGYFRISRYGKYLLSLSAILKKKPDQETFLALYDFDVKLRQILFFYCKKVEIKFKTAVSNSVSLKETNSVFYLEDSFYTKSKGERDSNKRERNARYYSIFKSELIKKERDIRNKAHKYPEFVEYRTGGIRSRKKIPCWAAFSYFEFGTVETLYSYLRGDLKKEVLEYGYERKNYTKIDTEIIESWLSAVRNLRNICAHHNRIVGRTSSVVRLDHSEQNDLLQSQTDLFSRIYAVNKLISDEDRRNLKKELQSLIKKSKIDIFKLKILPVDWESKYDLIIKF